MGDLRSRILLFDILPKICFVCINNVYLNFRTRFQLISANMINTNEADFRRDIKWQDTGPWLTTFRHFVLGLKLLSGDQPNILRHVSNELLTHKITID